MTSLSTCGYNLKTTKDIIAQRVKKLKKPFEIFPMSLPMQH